MTKNSFNKGNVNKKEVHDIVETSSGGGTVTGSDGIEVTGSNIKAKYDNSSVILNNSSELSVSDVYVDNRAIIQALIFG